MPAKTAVTGTSEERREARWRRQMDLFGTAGGSIGEAPRWMDLPDRTRAALTELMARLIVDHAEQAARPQVREASDEL